MKKIPASYSDRDSVGHTVHARGIMVQFPVVSSQIAFVLYLCSYGLVCYSIGAGTGFGTPLHFSTASYRPVRKGFARHVKKEIKNIVYI
jgi:hypothetical protein